MQSGEKLPIDLGFSKAIDAINMSNIKNSMMYLSSFATRATGYEGNYRAAQYIYDKFVEYGLRNVTLHRFTVVDAIDHGANLTLLEDGITIKIYPLVPNDICPSTTSPEGITGKLIYVGDGFLKDFDGKDIEGNIVVMNWDSGQRWITAAKLGAKAVIFLPPKTNYIGSLEGYVASKYLEHTPFNFPRFYIDGVDADLLVKNLMKDARIVAHTVWQKIEAKNVIGFIKGTAYPDSIVILSSYYDSYAVTPSLAPGAQESAGISTLLELARFFSLNKPSCSILFVAFGAHHQCLQGAINFINDYIYPNRSSLEPNIIVMFNIDLSTGSDVVYFTCISTLFGSSSTSWLSERGYYPVGAYFMQVQRKINEQRPKGRIYDAVWTPAAISHVYPNVYQMVSLPWKAFPYDHEPFVLLSGHGGGSPVAYTFTTAYDCRPYFWSPFDTFDKVNIQNLQKQVEFITCLLSSFLSENIREIVPDSAPEIRGSDQHWYGYGGKWFSWKGTVAYWDEKSAYYSPLTNETILVKMIQQGFQIPLSSFPTSGAIPENFHRRYTFAESDGTFLFKGGVVDNSYIVFSAWVINASTGSIVFAPNMGRYMYGRPGDVGYGGMGTHITISDLGYFVVFKAATFVIFDVCDPSFLGLPRTGEGGAITPNIRVNSFETHSVLDSFGCWYYPSNVWAEENVAVIAIPPNEKFEVIVQHIGERFPIAVLINSSDSEKFGSGYLVRNAGEQHILAYSILEYAEDLYHLTEIYCDVLAKYDPRLLSSTSHQLLERSRIPLEEAIGARVNNSYTKMFVYSIESWKNTLSVYNYVRSMKEDYSSSVVFFAALLIPFTYLAEKFTFNFRGKRKIISFLSIFICVMCIFYSIHPGFRIVASPEMITLGFSIIILISPIILILANNSLNFIKIIRTARMGKHEIDITRIGGAIQSFFTGVENLRKEGFRSILALFSIIAIIASVVSLTSMQFMVVIKALEIDVSPLYQGIYIRLNKWGAGTSLMQPVVDYLEAKYGDLCIIAPRAVRYVNKYWLTATPERVDQGLGWRVIFGNKSIFAPQIWGLTPQEDKISSITKFIEGLWFKPGDSGVIILTENQAKALGVSLFDKVNFEGVEKVVLGIIKSEYGMLTELDGEKITPIKIDFPPIVKNPWDVHVALDECFIVPYEDALALGGDAYSISIKPLEQSLAPNVAEEIFSILSGYNVYFGMQEKTYYYSKALSVALWGWESQIIPIIIAALTILNISIEKVYSRKRYISIYSALGLSPFHISLMFLSESLLLATLGGVGGYIVGVGFAKLFPIPTNYSSQGVLVSIFTSMFVLFLSSLYPSYLSARLVTPSITRKWKIMSKPLDDTWEVQFPMIINTDEESLGVISFIWEFLQSRHLPDSPVFSVISENLKIEPLEKVIEMEVRLAPYDAGVRQKAIFRVWKYENKWNINILMQRIEGPHDKWIDFNRRFLDAFRKQLLLWGSFSLQEKRIYSQKEMKKN